MKFMHKFKPEANTIKSFKHWVVLLREKQVTLGATIIAAKREVSSFAQLTKEEAGEFPEVVAWFEKTCKELYDAEKFNYVAAMMKDNFVHYHAFPRYSNEVNMYNIIWQDAAWPKVIEFTNAEHSASTLNQIITDMKR